MMSTDTDVLQPNSQPVLNATSSRSSSPLAPPHVDTHPQSPAGPSTLPKTCSVRGCNQALPQEATNRMCDACRARHRIYATTKRARRKAEKAAVVMGMGMGRVGERSSAGQASTSAARTTATPSSSSSRPQTQTGWMQPFAAPVTTSALTQTTTAAPANWDNTAIDPRLFAESAAQSASTVLLQHHTMAPPFARPPYASSSSSELAGALTLPGTPHSNVNGANGSTSSYYRAHVLEQKDDAQSREAEEHEVARALQAPEAEAEVDAGDAQQLADAAATATDAASAEGPGPLRPCSVKGCKDMIPSSYTFKMCPPCRTRYRTYGNTKRAKWKAEREAFDRELAGLRTEEDQRRKVAGEKPLSESPDDLRAWELSVMDEQVPLPARMTGSPATDDDPSALIQGSTYPPGTSPGLSGTAHLGARMCTVSHCHKLLPGFYRYKRCEQHRLQNRYHSQLKRVREKGEKAGTGTGLASGAGVSEGEGEVDGGGEGEDGGADGDAEEEEQTKEQAEGDGEPGDGSGEGDGEGEGEGGNDAENADKLKKRTRRRTTCEIKSCQNLLAPNVRWRRCDVCRARERVFKREQKELEELGGRLEKLREVAGAVGPAVGVGRGVMEVQVQAQAEPAAGSGASAEGTEQEKGKDQGEEGATGGELARDESHMASTSGTASGTASAAMDAVRNLDVNVTNDNNKEAVKPADSYPPASYPHTFQSVFRADLNCHSATSASADPTATPGTSIRTPAIGTPATATTAPAGPPPRDGSGAMQPTSANANANNTSTAEGQLKFHEYKPTAQSTGRGRGAEMGKQAQVFRDMVQRDQQTSNGMVGPSLYHIYRSTPPPPAQASSSVPTTALAPPAVAPAPASASTTYPPSAYTPYTVAATSSAPHAYEPPPAKKQKTQPTSTEAEQVPKQNGQPSAGPGKSPVVNAIASSSETASSTQPVSAPQAPPSPPSTVISGQPKAPPRRTEQLPPATAAPTSHTYPPYSYTSPAPYPYSYYLPQPYAYMPPPRPSSSSSTPGPLAPYPSYPYPYAYAYPPAGYYPPGAPPPGYGYLPPRYPPHAYSSVYAQSSASRPYYQGAYNNTATYGYPTAPVKDKAFAYYQGPPDKSGADKRKRKRDEEEEEESAPARAPTASAAAPAPDPMSPYADALPPPLMPLPTQEHVPRPAEAAPSRPPAASTAPTPAVATGKAAVSTEPVVDQSPKSPSLAQPSARPCANKACHRTIPAGAVGTLCEKCRARIKRHQAKTRQRFKLEPRKSMLIGRESSTGRSKVAVTDEAAGTGVSEVAAAA
ncbi:hypothetical protein LshimejAT787_0601130 [Lyophyllum shimeji]|uniref:Uncharacterized protein n=1 Tax=Lyophyllum shimeji TaxID=47721 RepID=A0A9P3UQ73_LYOSH|nr:hypothetical protein LshimejAT787_0601130 [Lyophyllum shimeji]